MNCFVIMPFANEFDDVYATIKATVESVILPPEGKCFRLDEARPAGRITDRLLHEIGTATLCIADVTGNIPNVMWEVGYAMALGKPIILITQKISELPFDIKDMQSLQYDRTQLSRTLGNPLQKTVLDTLKTVGGATPSKEQDEFVGFLLSEIKELKSMISNVVKDWNSLEKIDKTESLDLSMFEGAWINKENQTHLYVKVINNELIAPYCYSGNNELTAVYYGWKQAGEYWFAKFQWLYLRISGFTFLRQDSLDSFSGAWWSDEDVEATIESPPPFAGVAMRWERVKKFEYPVWALKFFEMVQEIGLEKILAQPRS